jgi:hypothetical protein
MLAKVKRAFPTNHSERESKGTNNDNVDKRISFATYKNFS